jgi:hypothetical protein
VINIGVRPTLHPEGRRDPVIKPMLDFEGNLYGDAMALVSGAPAPSGTSNQSPPERADLKISRSLAVRETNYAMGCQNKPSDQEDQKWLFVDGVKDRSLSSALTRPNWIPSSRILRNPRVFGN